MGTEIAIIAVEGRSFGPWPGMDEMRSGPRPMPSVAIASTGADRTRGASDYAYQLAFFIPGIIPWCASSRSMIREIPNLL